jgi:D-alanyl-D-alanine-carboxypeptidase/D-alanyl-D-alanine-endopeptidase
VGVVTLVAVIANIRAILVKPLLSDGEIRELLVDHVDVQHKSVGMVVGIVTPQGRRILSYGQMSQGDTRPLGGDTVFEVGSVTKIFTALLLADMAQRGEVALDDPVVKYLPADVKVPARNGRQITLADLATHTSGLPFFPTDVPLGDLAEAGRILANYSVAQVHRFLSSYALPAAADSNWAYSNLGYGLLGEALSRRAGEDYETLLRTRISEPLGLTSTAITVSPGMRTRLAGGHDEKLRAAPEVNMPAFVAAGCLRSTANDLLTLLEACAGLKKSPLAPAMAAMLATRRPGPGVEQALGWWLPKVGADDMGFVAFGGQTPGFAATIAYDPKNQVGVVVLSNGTADDGGIGWHVLRAAFPVKTAAVVKARQELLRNEVKVDPKLLDAYAGEYRVTSGPTVGQVVTIERQENGLILKSPTSPPEGLRLHPESQKMFSILDGGIQMSFDSDEGGRVSRLVFRAAGTDTPAVRISTPGRIL